MDTSPSGLPPSSPRVRDEPEQPVFPTTHPPRWLKSLFAVVFLLLVGQLFLRQTRSEPFPTFLLPAGASLYHADADADGGIYKRTTYYAVAQDGTRTPVRLSRILREVPGSYRGHIARDDFGLRAPGPRGAAARVGPLRIPLSMGVTTEEELSATKEWLRRRLEQRAGHSVAALRVVKRSYRLSPEDGTESVLQTSSDAVFSLLPDS